MRKFRAVHIVVVGVLVLGLASVALGMKEQPRLLPPPDYAVGRLPAAGPFVILQQGDTTWIQPYPDTTYCPGDPLAGHGGEATGGPTGADTWCFEGGPGDTCGVVAPWDSTLCFDHEDVRTFPSMTNTNFWHLDTYRTSERLYCGNWALWCGSDSIWAGDSLPVECGTWAPGKYPGYGNTWNCIVQLDLDVDFTIATGCTLWFDPRYDTECKYDYFYVDFWEGSEWFTLAMFNASSDHPGSECGAPGSGNPDYWGNTDSGQPNNARWQTRSVTGEPAFYWPLDDSLIDIVTSAPSFRWRFVSDGAWSDMDGRGNTDGACFIDNVWVSGDNPVGGLGHENLYKEDFEDGDWPTLEARGWSKPAPDPIAQAWHIVHDPDAPFEGGDGGDRTTCTLDSSFVWRARPELGYPGTAAWRNGWFYRLLSPTVPITNSGCVVHYDQFMCCQEYTCDYTNSKVRFYNSEYDKWCPWNDIDGYITYGGCFFWNFDLEENVTPFYGPDADSMRFAWELLDVSALTDFCRGKHKGTDNIIDNISIGFFDGEATIFRARVIDIFQDSFHDSLPAYNSSFDAYSLDTLDLYSHPYTTIIRKNQQLYLDVSDKNHIREVRLFGSVDEGANWQSVTMTLELAFDPNDVALGGEYYGTLYPTDFPPLQRWDIGTEIRYYVRCEDQVGTPGNYAYFPADADPTSPDHTGGRADYFTFSIMPMFPDSLALPPDGYTGIKILLVDGYGRNNYDYTDCMVRADNIVPLEDIYENTLRDAGYCYDKFDISGAGSNIHVQPLQYTDYDAVVWFTGPYFGNYLFDKEAQYAIRAYLAGGGKFVLCGDRIAYNMTPVQVGEDSLGGHFLAGIMGCTYQAEMESPFSVTTTADYVYLDAVPSVNVFGTPVSTSGLLSNTVIYRQCPYLKDMSYVLTNGSPPTGYVAQPVMYLNPVPDPAYDPADGVIYVEYLGTGQCTYVNYDMCGWVNHTRTACGGGAPPGLPGFTSGTYDGRVELMRFILENLYGLPSSGTGQGGTSDTPAAAVFRWALGQNMPNPAAGATEIKFEVARTSDVSIKVFNAMGQLVRTLENSRREPGRYSVHWDGTNAVGEKVSSGVYFYKMHTNNFNSTRKMLILK